MNKFNVCLLAAALGLICAPETPYAQAPPTTYPQVAPATYPCCIVSRPIPLGSWGGSIDYSAFRNGDCSGLAGTLAALVQDQNNVQYLLSAAHVFAVTTNGYHANGSNTPISQPPNFAGTGCISPAAYAAAIIPFEVANLSFVSLSLSPATYNPADAAIAKIIPGRVSTSGPYAYSGLPVTVLKKGLQVRKFGANGTSTASITVAKSPIPVHLLECSELPPNQNAPLNCLKREVRFVNQIIVNPVLGTPGDSGALVTTTDSCPQVVGMLIGPHTVTPIANVLSALVASGAPSITSLKVVPSPGAGCQPPAQQIAAYDTADPDVIQAQTAQSQLIATLAGWMPGIIEGVGIDLSGTQATLDVVVTDGVVQLGNYGYETWLQFVQNAGIVPSQVNGVPVETEEVMVEDTTVMDRSP